MSYLNELLKYNIFCFKILKFFSKYKNAKLKTLKTKILNIKKKYRDKILKQYSKKKKQKKKKRYDF